MKFTVLGPLTVTCGDKKITPRPQKLQGLLGLLLIRHHEVVHAEDLIEELWGKQPPASAASTLQSYVYRLRQLLSGGAADAQVSLDKCPGGYQLLVPPDDLDLCRFQRLTEEGRTHLAEGDAGRAFAALDAATSLWGGYPLAGTELGRHLMVQVTLLQESRLKAIEWRAEASLENGRYHDLITELQEHISANPQHEGLIAMLMKAQHMSGRSAEAVATYRRVRRSFAEDLGLEPSPGLRRMYRDLVASARSGGPITEKVTCRSRSRSFPLPSDIPGFVGRQEIIGSLARRLTADRGPGIATPIVAITGAPGVGKTALAVRLAHRLRPRFRDGVYFVSFPATPSQDQLLGLFEKVLNALGVPAVERPCGLEEYSSTFRTWTTDKNMLIVLDNPPTAREAHLFVPGCAENCVIIASRSAMYGLAGAHVVELDAMSLADGVRLLGTQLGQNRVAEALSDAERIVRLCECLPQAIHGAATRLRAVPHVSLGTYANRLAATTRRLLELNGGNIDVGDGYDSGYVRLNETERHVLRRICKSNMSGFTTIRVSRLLGWTLEDAGKVLTQLVEYRFLRVSGRDPSGELHYAFAPMSRAYVWERVIAPLNGEGYQ